MEETLGNRLRTARDAAGISVDDAVYLAKIPRAVVEALEAEDFGFFTSPLYARSFLKQYSAYIGADVDSWLDDLEPTTMIDGDNVESYIDIAEPVVTVVTHEKSRGKSGGGAWAALWMVVITGGVVWGGMKIYANFENKLSETSLPEEEISAEPKTATNEETEPPITQAESKPIASTIPEPPPRAIPVLPDEE